MSVEPGPEPAATTKAERALDLARARYTLGRGGRGPYAVHGGQRYLFQGPDRTMLRADIKSAWREKFPGEAPPPDPRVNSVIEDLKLLAMKAEPDPADDDSQEPGEARPQGVGGWLDARGVTGAAPEDRGIGLVFNSSGCPLPPGYVVPPDYLVTPTDIWYLAGRWGMPVRAAWAWLFPVQVYIDPDGDQWLELAWRDQGQWVSRLVRRAVSKSGRKLVAEFGDAGLPITDSEARDAEKWIAAAEAANHAVIGRHPVARQLGWQADGKTFVTAADTPWRVEPRYADQAAALAAHQPSGTLDGWREAIKGAEGYPVVQAGLYAGLAGPLLVPLGLDSFTLDISGRSTRGKTITAQVALSCWADPSEKGDGIFSWKTKMIGVEKRLNLVNGLPVVIDETRVATSTELVDAVIYQIPKNHGQARGGGWPNMIPWRAIVISTGEQPATSFTTHQGANARVLSIQQAPFGTAGDTSRAAAEAVKRGIEANHGTAGPAFTARLRDMLDAPGGLARLRERHAEMTSRLRGSSDMSGRRAPLIAVLALAAELACEWGIAPFAPPGPDGWMGLFAASDPRDNRAEMALDVVREYIATHQDKMYGPAAGATAPGAGWIGHDAKEGPALLPEKLREELKRRGYDLDAVYPGWLEMGALVTMPSQRPPYLIPRRTGGRQTKHVIFKRDVIDPDASES